MTSRGGRVGESWRDAPREIVLILVFGVVGVVAGSLPSTIGAGWSIGIAAVAIVGVLAVLVAYRRRKAREAETERTAMLARLLAETAQSKPGALEVGVPENRGPRADGDDPRAA